MEDYACMENLKFGLAWFGLFPRVFHTFQCSP